MTILCFLIALLTLAPAGLAQAAPATQPAPTYSRPLGIAMETWPYPYPVQFLSLTLEGQTVRMAYMDVKPAKANGRTVLLLHGKNFWGAYWEPVIRSLAAAGYRVVVPDQIGFGKSAKPDIHYSFDLLAQNTAALLDHLAIDRTAVVGHSMGGMLAVRFARNYPQRTSALVLEDPIGLEDYRLKVPPTPTEALFQKELHKSVEGVRAYYQTYFTQWKPAYEQFVEVNARVMLSGEYPRYAMASAQTTQMIYQQPVRHEFHLITAPTLLVVGLEDRTTLGRGQVSPAVLATLGQYPQLGKQAAKDIPDCKLIELPNVGHIPHLDVPEQFNRDLRAFLQGVQPPQDAP